MRKPRILMVNEASYLASGYSTYGMEVQRRLFETGKYDMSELCVYGKQGDYRLYDIPWKTYPNVPPDGHEEWGRYRSRISNEFGEWKFNDVLLDFRPDVVWDIRDPWMFAFEERSPFREFFRWAIMPTVDAIPQQEQWLSTYADADAVLTYTDWGRKVLEDEGGGMIRLRGTAPPGADLDTFRPMPKEELRAGFGGFEPGINIVGMTARNQPRKLYPQLIRDFARFLDIAEPEVARKTFLYLHVSYPDNGWNIPGLIKQSGISHKIIVTYRCRQCEVVFPSLFQDARGICVKCGRPAATLPNVEHSVGRDTMAKIVNLFDVYVQYSVCEGFGMPMVEAAACGVPVMAVDYSGMSDVVRKVGGFPIAVSRLDPEPGSERLMSRPDGGDFVATLIWFFGVDECVRRSMSARARVGVEGNYTWDRSAARWMEVFDSFPLRDHSTTWDSPPRVHGETIPLPPRFPSNEALVDWGIVNLLGRPELRRSYLALRMIRDLNWGWTFQASDGYHSEDSLLGQRRQSRRFAEDDAIAELRGIRGLYDEWEEKRCRMVR